MTWHDHAACIGSDLNFVHPADRDEIFACVEVCDRCPVRTQCAKDAAKGPAAGVWGGKWLGGELPSTPHLGTRGGEMGRPSTRPLIEAALKPRWQTVRKIADTAHTSPETARRHLHEMERDGTAERDTEHGGHGWRHTTNNND